jgi:hypothetical protein
LLFGYTLPRRLTGRPVAQVAFRGGLAPTIAIIRTTGYGALQPMTDDPAYG